MSSTNAPKAVKVPEPSGYGYWEMKDIIRKFTWRSFIITVSMTALLLIANFVTQKVQAARKTAPKMAPIVKLSIEQLPPPSSDDQAEIAPPPPTQQVVNTGPAARAGTPVAVPDADITPDMQDFAAIDEMSRASAEGGDGLDLGGFAGNIDFNTEEKVDVKVREEEPAPDEFIPVEKEPGVDLPKLQKLIEYPDMARRAGVEGQVIVRVLVDAKGKPKKTLIEYTDNELLNDAAVKAIGDYGTFTPAIQNGQPIMCWVSIPIRFRLR
jgi:protein TonB